MACGYLQMNVQCKSRISTQGPNLSSKKVSSVKIISLWDAATQQTAQWDFNALGVATKIHISLPWESEGQMKGIGVMLQGSHITEKYYIIFIQLVMCFFYDSALE